MDFRLQARGGTEAYSHYFAGMDKTMRQKVALVASFFPTKGRIADMGSGSGSGSYDLASLYPNLSVIGVDLDPNTVKYAAEQYRRPNLVFEIGDIAEQNYPAESFDGILNSSVLHHVTTFSGYSRARLTPLLDAQTAMLREGGILVIRDFVAPEDSPDIFLDLPADPLTRPHPGAAGELARMSPAQLFEKFIVDFRTERYAKGGGPFAKLDALAEGGIRYRTDLRTAVEFVLHKDYRENWDLEIREEYTYFSKSEFEAEFERRGLRIVLSRYLYNPWVIRHRFAGQFEMRSIENGLLPYPPTNYIIVGEKTSAGRRLFEKSSTAAANPQFLGMAHYKIGSKVYDLASRPGVTFDLLPWFRVGEEVEFLCRQGYPRPIINSHNRTPPLEGEMLSGYINEPIVAIGSESEDRLKSIVNTLRERAGISDAAVKRIAPALRYLPTPGGVGEMVESYAVEIEPVQTAAAEFKSGFSTPGRIRALQATHTLRSAQVGGMFDARLEINLYHLLLDQRLPLGPWIGAEVEPVESGYVPQASPFADILGPPADVPERCDNAAGYLQIWQGHFAEQLAGREQSRTVTLEYVTPGTSSTNTAAIVIFAFSGHVPLIAIEQYEIPAAALFGSSRTLPTVPAFRLPRDIGSTPAAAKFIMAEIESKYGITCTEPTPLGGSYFPSAGVTPESVTPFFAQAISQRPAEGQLKWVELQELTAGRTKILDGHLLVGILRFAHALQGTAGFTSRA